MSSVADLDAALARIASAVPFAQLRAVLDTLDEIWAVLADEAADSNNDYIYAASESISRARAALAEAIDLIRAGTADLDEYRTSIGITPPLPEATPAPPTPPSPTQSLSELPEWTPRNHKVRGTWIDRDGQKHELVSGQHDEWFQRATRHAVGLGLIPPGVGIETASHVELKFAMRMREAGLTRETIVINKEPCPDRLGCHKLLPSFLPEGAELTVYSRRGFKHTYRGEGNPE